MHNAIDVIETERFSGWLVELGDPLGAAAIARRIRRFKLGLFGNVKAVGASVMEARVDVGPGYRVSYVRRGRRIVVLLCSGDKKSQSRDIVAAKAMAKELEAL